MVKYEDLRKNTLTEMKKIYQFLGNNATDEELKKLKEKNDFEKIPASLKGKGKFNRTALVGGWKNNFSENEQKLMNTIMSDTLKQFDYEI